MIHSIKIFIICLFAFVSPGNQIYAQTKGAWELYNPTYLKLTADVKIIDSQYIFVPQLKVLEEGKSIQIHKSLYPEIESSPLADIKITVEKQVRCVYQNIYVPALRQQLYDKDYMLFKDYKYTDVLKDSINLDPYFALETGNYRILISLRFYSQGEEGLVNSDWTFFEVTFDPKNSLWGNCK